jgi:hypothetical protein
MGFDENCLPGEKLDGKIEHYYRESIHKFLKIRGFYKKENIPLFQTPVASVLQTSSGRC